MAVRAEDARDLVIYDGDCGVCQASKDWAAGLDATGRLGFSAFQTADLAKVAPGLSPEMASQALHFIRSDGRRFQGARAVFETMQRLPGVWGVLGAILSFPVLSFLAEPFYRLFARYRGHVSRYLGLDRCAIPPADLV
jgi:predicted DCC family thiol-disulfide oxidoreductase YuxK